MPYIDDAENANWLQQVRLKGKKFDRVDMVSLETTMGDTKEFKSKKGNIVKTIHSTYLQTFNPGDEGYIDAVLIDKVRNRLGMEIA